MKKQLLLYAFFASMTLFAQKKISAYDKGEWLKYRVHYGFVNAGYATLEVNEVVKNNLPHFHFKGKGWTVGVSSWFFKVDDRYESFVNKENSLPTHAVRRVNEGGYIINRDTYFDHTKKIALVEDHKNKTKKEFDASDVQDMISAFYLLRNYNLEGLSVGESVQIKMFFDDTIFPFKMKYLGKENMKTDFGTIPCYKLRPYVQSERVFKEKESLTLWVSADSAKVPVRIQAALAVGSIKVDLLEYKGLSYPFSFI